MTEKEIFSYLTSHGLTEEGTAGLMGNMFAESGFKSNNLQNSSNKNLNITDEAYTAAVDQGIISKDDFINLKTGYGLCQWTTKDRKAGLYNLKILRNTSISDAAMQLDFLFYELTNSYKTVYNVLKTTKNIKEASDIVLTKFEMPKDQSDKVKNLRASYGTAIYNRCSNSNKSVINGLSPKAVIDEANKWIGYLEKSKAAYAINPNVIYSFTDGAGSDNITVFGLAMHQLYPKTMDFGAPWCDSFVDYCFYAAYGVTNAKKMIGGEFDDYTVNSMAMYKKMYALDNNVKIGDQVFFLRPNGTPKHTGIVVEVTNESFTTIEGNTSGGANIVIPNGGGVFKKTYLKSLFSGKVMFGHPKYDIVDDVTTTEAKSAMITPTLKSEDTFKVKILAHSLRIRSGPGTNYSITGYINDKGVYTIIETNNAWGKLKSGKGWISLNPDYTKKL